MANFRDPVIKVQRKRKIAGICPPGYHWVKEHYASGKFGFRIKWVPGHCAKDGTPHEIEVTRIEKRTKYKLPLVDLERITVEGPIDNGVKTESHDSDNKIK